MQLISPERLAKILDVPVVTVYAWKRRGVLPFVQLERCVRFDLTEIQSWIDARKKPALKKRAVQV
jgi:excisionase family DNA binding protein